MKKTDTKDIEKGVKRTKLILIIVLIIVVLAAIGVGGFFLYKNLKGDTATPELTDQVKEDMGVSTIDTSEAFGAYGITSIDTDNETFDVDDMVSSLEVEEIYITSGTSVTEGDKILKFTEDSVETVREELTEALREAELAYRSGVIEYAQKQITLEYDRQLSVLEGEQADEVYDETVASLDSSVEKAKESLDDIKEQIADYEEDLANDTYKAAYDEAQDEYDDTLEAIKELLEEWQVSWSEITSGMARADFSTEHSQYVYVLTKMYNILEDNLDTLESAEEEYEDSGNESVMTYYLNYLQTQLASYEETYTEAKKSYEENVLEAELTKQKSLNEADSADKTYETDLEAAEADYDELEEAYEDAKESLENFEALAGDGYYYAQSSGTVLRMSLRSGRTVTSDTVMYTMSNPDTMTVTVSVDQDNISQVAVGDTVYVYSEDTGTYSGLVTSVSPVTSSSSVSSVTYSVIVTMQGDFSTLSTNETVSVYFGLGGTNGRED